MRTKRIAKFICPYAVALQWIPRPCHPWRHRPCQLVGLPCRRHPMPVVPSVVLTTQPPESRPLGARPPPGRVQGSRTAPKGHTTPLDCGARPAPKRGPRHGTPHIGGTYPPSPWAPLLAPSQRPGAPRMCKQVRCCAAPNRPGTSPLRPEGWGLPQCLSPALGSVTASL